MTPEQLAELRATLPPWADRVANAPLLDQYREFYRIDFARGDPGLEHHVGTVASGEYRLCVQLWQRAEASSNLVLLHGYFDHTGIYGKLIEYGLSRNCNVLIFDLPGHGLSTGEPAVIDTFSDYSRAIVNVLTTVSLPDLPLWVMAQSTGCAALVDYASKNSWPFVTAVMLAPLVRPQGWLRVRGGHTLLRRFVDSIPRRFNRNSSDLEFLEFIQRDPLQSLRMPLRWIGALRRWLRALPQVDLRVGPILVVQGDEDNTVAWRHNLKVVNQLFPGSRVEYLPGAGHQLANESTEIRQRYLAAVDDWLLRCGLPLKQHATANSTLDTGQLGQGYVGVLGVDIDNNVAD